MRWMSETKLASARLLQSKILRGEDISQPLAQLFLHPPQEAHRETISAYSCRPRFLILPVRRFSCWCHDYGFVHDRGLVAGFLAAREHPPECDGVLISRMESTPFRALIRTRGRLYST